MPVSFTPNQVVQARGLRPSTGPATTFRENFGEAFDFMVREGQSVSSARAVRDPLHDVLTAFEEYGADTNFTQVFGAASLEPEQRPNILTTEVDRFNKQVEELRTQFPDDVRLKTIAQIKQDVTAKLAGERDAFLETTSRATGMGKFGAFLGTAAGATVDPMILATLPFGASWSTSILRSLAIEGAIAFTAEIPIQAEVFRFKREIGSPYGLSDASLAVLGATVGGAAGAGILRGVTRIPRGGRALVRFIRKEQEAGRLRPSTPREKQAEEFLESLADEQDTSPFPREPRDDQVHAQRTQAALDEVIEDAPRTFEAPEAAKTRIIVDGQEIPIPEKLQATLKEIEAREAAPTHKINTPERIAMREQIHDQLYGKGAKKKDRIADIVLGSPGAGKSSAVAEPLARERGALIIDPDDAKVRIPEYDDGVGASQIHRESSDIAARLLLTASAIGDNIVLSATGKSLKKLRNQIRLLTSKGYSVRLHHVDVPTPEAIKRTITQFEETGRPISPELVAKIAKESRKSFDQIIKEGGIDAKTLWNNQVPRGQAARVIETTDEAIRGGLRGPGRQGPSVRAQEPRPASRRPGARPTDEIGTHAPDEIRMQAAREAADEYLKDFDSPLSRTRLDQEYNRIMNDMPPETRVPVGERIDPKTGEVVADTISVRELIADVDEAQRVVDAFNKCRPAA